MAYRQFTDASGAEWTVYDVNPRMQERRAGDRRDPTHYNDESQLDRRGDDRRATVTTGRPVRITRGWLCFESKTERRRLQPIPNGWHVMSESELVGLLEQARVAPRRANPNQQSGAGRP